MAESVAPTQLGGLSIVATRLDLARLGALRSAVVRCASAHGLAGARLDGFVLAVNEIVTNAVAHGGGRGWLRIWRSDGALNCEVRDDGPGIPAEYLDDHDRPAPTALRGRGLWLARHVCDLVSIVSDRRGTTVRIVTALPS